MQWDGWITQNIFLYLFFYELINVSRTNCQLAALVECLIQHFRVCFFVCFF